MKSHRLGADINGVGEQPEQEVGHDDRAFDTGIHHVTTVPVARTKPVIKEGVGPYIPNNIQGPSSWHGELPTESAADTHDQYLQAEHMATHTADTQVPVKYYPDPVPVIVVPPDSGPGNITAGRSNFLEVDPSGGSATEIVPKDMHRSRVLITNEHATVGVRIAGHRGEGTQGYLLKAGDSREFFQQTQMFAWPADGTTVIPVSFWAEYSRVL